MTEIIKNKKEGIDSQRRLWEFVFVAILVLYPLRHIAWGLDLWDTGYGYANFEYMGTQHMDPMWLFSTYLTTAIGHFFSLLPGAGTLIGMNFYTCSIWYPWSVCIWALPGGKRGGCLPPE